jgi:lipid-binding SYLF domain-containing protein
MSTYTPAIVSCALALAACASTNQGTATTVTSGEVASTEAARLEESTEVVRDLRDKVPEEVIQQARCVVVIPSMASGGLIVGAEHGHGFASCRTGSGWSAPEPVSISSGTVGAQVGYQSADLLMLVVTEDAKNRLFESRLDLGGDVAAAAGPVGTGKGTDFDRHAGILTYSRANGLYAGANLRSGVIHTDDDAMAAIYGSPREPSALLSGQIGAPPQTQRFLAEMTQTFR